MKLERANNNLTKRVLTHVLFWLFYVLFFGSIYGKYGNDYTWYLLESLCMLPFIMAASYITIYLFLPFYLRRKNLALTIFLQVILLFLATLGERIALKKLNGLPINFDTVFGVTFLYLVLETNFMVAIAFAIKIVKKWFIQQQEKHEVEKRNLTNELKLLKTQLHPHFLFNTMNNLYALSLEESSKTSAGIAKISELLRSVLYDCNDPEIDLEKEVSLIENFIELEKMRYDKKLDISLLIDGEISGHKIAPMILFTFVENCFKHGLRQKNGSPFVNIELSTSKHIISFITENSISNKLKVTKRKTGGIGLKNVKKRLDLIYADRYSLKINKEENKFRVKLEIKKSE